MSKSTESLKEWCLKNPEKGEKLIKEWDAEKNRELFGRDMEDFKLSSNYRVNWVCSQCKHPFEQRIVNRVKYGCGCKECNKFKRANYVTEEKSIAALDKELASYYDTEANEIDIRTLGRFSTKEVAWYCKKCNHKWRTTPKNLAMLKNICPNCKRENTQYMRKKREAELLNQVVVQA